MVSWIEFLNTLLVLISNIISCSTTFTLLGEFMVQRGDETATTKDVVALLGEAYTEFTETVIKV